MYIKKYVHRYIYYLLYYTNISARNNVLTFLTTINNTYYKYVNIILFIILYKFIMCQYTNGISN